VRKQNLQVVISAGLISLGLAWLADANYAQTSGYDAGCKNANKSASL